MTTTTSLIQEFVDNEWIYFNYQKYVVSLFFIDSDIFIEKLKESVTTQNEEDDIICQKIIFQHMEIIKDPVKRICLIYYYGTHILKACKPNCFPNIEFYNENSSVILEKINIKIEEIRALIAKINFTDFEKFKILKKFVEHGRITISEYLLSLKFPEYFDNTHFFETIGDTPMNPYFFHYFEKFDYPKLSQKDLDKKLFDAYNRNNIHLVKYWVKKGGRVEKLTIKYFSTSLEYYEIVKFLLANGFIFDVKTLKYPGDNIVTPLFADKLKNKNIEEITKMVDDISDENKIELVSYIVQKIKKN